MGKEKATTLLITAVKRYWLRHWISKTSGFIHYPAPDKFAFLPPPSHFLALFKDDLTSNHRWKFYNGSVYFLSQEAKPWQEAEDTCRAQEAHLVSITSKEEMVSTHTGPSYP
uniref:C-type lectin domain-containing protein n=1 Tax=Podarcis muralis TaxID=64176 RepID=A0A670IXJ5_PODMU